MNHNDFHGGYMTPTISTERKIIDYSPEQMFPPIVYDEITHLQFGKWHGLFIRRSGKRYYIADAFKQRRVTPWRRVSYVRVAELLVLHETFWSIIERDAFVL